MASNRVKFSKDYAFVYYRFEKSRYTDARSGADRHFIGVLEAGHCRIVTRDQVLELSPGDSFYIPLGLSYQSYWDGAVIAFRSYGFLPFPDGAANRYRLQALPPGFTPKFQAVATQKTPDTAALGAFYTVLAEALPYMQTQPEDPAVELLEMARAYLYRHPHCHMEDLAKHCAMSQSALYHAFSRNGLPTPNALRQQVQVERAVTLLTTTDLPVSQISDRLGFSSPSYFRKIFKAHTGRSPLQLRSQARIP